MMHRPGYISRDLRSTFPNSSRRRAASCRRPARQSVHRLQNFRVRLCTRRIAGDHSRRRTPPDLMYTFRKKSCCFRTYSALPARRLHPGPDRRRPRDAGPGPPGHPGNGGPGPVSAPLPHLARVHDARRIERLLDRLHQVHRSVAVLGAQELQLSQPDPVFAAGCSERRTGSRCARTSAHRAWTGNRHRTRPDHGGGTAAISSTIASVRPDIVWGSARPTRPRRIRRASSSERAGTVWNTSA